MVPETNRRLDLRWTAANLGAAAVLCLLCAAAMAAGRAGGRFELGEKPAVDARRVQAAAERVNPNTAAPASLRRLPELGPARVQWILDYRAGFEGGAAFREPNDLKRVHGIGDGLLKDFREYLLFDPPGRP